MSATTVNPMVAAVLTIVSLALMALGGLTIPANLFATGSRQAAAAFAFVLFGIAGLSIEEALGVEFGVNGLSAKDRQVLLGLSVFLVSAGAVATPFGAPPAISF